MRSNGSPRGYRLFALFSAALILLTLNSAPLAAQSYSHARIVRLSFVEGTVTLRRHGVDQWAKAFINTPIEQGFKLATDANSFAEVEFENGSTVRLGQLSEIDFTNLSLTPDGGKINHMTLTRGYATFTVMPQRGDVYDVRAAGTTYSVAGNDMFRVDLREDGQRLEVFKGNVAVQSRYGNTTVAKNHVLRLIPTNAKPLQVTDGITEDAWDRWVNKRQQAETLASNREGKRNSMSARNSLYGWSDLSYFGTWTSLPGYGSCWAPSMGAGWSPYSIGRWAWYPGFGYTWISALSWGWLPFHYGSWIYPAGLGGWCWQPGNLSYWSPGLVTWYQGPGWVGWAPRTAGGGAMPAACSAGRGCSTAVSLNTFQSGRPISPNDVMMVNAFHGRRLHSPTVPLTRELRLPGPVAFHHPGTSAQIRNHEIHGVIGSSSVARARADHIAAAPTRVIPTGAIRGAWNEQPHAPSALSPHLSRFMNGSNTSFQVLRGNRPVRAGAVDHPTVMKGMPARRSTSVSRGRPAVNNDMLLPGRTGMRRSSLPGNRAAGLTSIPISAAGSHRTTKSSSTSLLPSARPGGHRTMTRSFEPPRGTQVRHNNFPASNRTMRRFHADHSQSRPTMNRHFNMPQSRGQSAPSYHPSPRSFGNGGTMNRSSGHMGGGMRGGGMSHMGSGMHGSAPAPHGPHH